MICNENVPNLNTDCFQISVGTMKSANVPPTGNGNGTDLNTVKSALVQKLLSLCNLLQTWVKRKSMPKYFLCNYFFFGEK